MYRFFLNGLILLLVSIMPSCVEEEMRDVIPPVVTILDPEKDQIVGQQFELIYNIVEENIDSISLFLGHHYIKDLHQLTQKVNIDVGNIEEGSYYLKLFAFDLSGNFGADSTLVFLIRPDNEPPVILKMIPDSGTFKDSFDVEIEASDNKEVRSVKLFFNNGLVGESFNAPYQFSVDVSSYRNGVYPLKAIASDYEGNEATVSYDINIVNEPNMEKPLNFEASKGLSWNSISLSWQRVPGAVNYEVYRLDKGMNEYVLIGSSDSNKYTDVFSEIDSPLTEIYYKVRAFNSEVEFGVFSNSDFGYYTKAYDVVLSFGKEGNNPGEFMFSEHVTLDDSGNFYISETSNGSIQKFSPDGVFLEKFYSCGSPRGMQFIGTDKVLVTCSSEYKVKIIDRNKNMIRQWGSSGNGNGQFNYFRQVALDEGIVYIVDHSNHRVQKLDLEGNFLKKWGSEGTVDNRFLYPWGITIHKEMVVVSSDNRLQFFNKDGAFIKSLKFDSQLYDLASDGEFIYIAAGNVILKIDEDRKFIDRIGDKDLTVAMGVAIKENGDVVAMDTYGRKLKIFRKKN
ncbi:MAG TPA: Ig-like domain-containing protein [Anditalea sp.]|nr:Ig-like domain-containing protein [Anditalea sp.]